MTSDRTMTIRLPREVAEELGIVAQVKESPVSEVIRQAIKEHIEKAKASPEFQTELRKRIERAKGLLS